MALVGSLSVSMSAETQQFEQGMRRARGTLGEMRTSVTQTQGTISGLGTALLGLAGVALSLEGLRRGLTAVVTAGEDLRQTVRTFALVKGSAEAGAASLAFVRETARTLGAEFGTLQSSYTSLSAASKGTSLEGAATDRMFKELTASAAAMNLSTDQSSGVFLAFQQILSKGRITAEDFNQIAERIPGALGVAARSMGVTTHEFVAMRDAGQLLTSDLAKITHQLYEEIGKKGTEGVETLAKSWVGLKNAMTEALEAADRFGASTAIKFLVDTFARGVRGLTPAPPLPGGLSDRAEVRHLQQTYPGAVISGSPEAVALEATIRELQAAQEQLAALKKVQAGLPANAQGFTESDIAHVTEQVDRLTYAYNVQLETLKKLGEVSQLKAQRDKEPAVPGAVTPEQLTSASQLQAEIQQRITGITSTLAKLDQQQQHGADSTEIRTKKIEALSKAILELQGILARPDAAALLPLLQGGSLQTPIRGIPIARWQEQIPRIQRIAEKVGIDPALLAAIVTQESSFNPRAVSQAGAQGLGQLMPARQRDYGVKDPFDPEQNLAGAAMYVRDLQRLYGADNLKVVLSGYNSSDPKRGYERFPETRNFVDRVTENYNMLRGGTGGQPQPQPLTQIQELKDLLFKLQEPDRLAQSAGLREQDLQPLLDKLKEMRAALLPAGETLIEQTQREIDAFNAKQPPEGQIGEGTRRLLLSRAEQAQRRMQEDAWAQHAGTEPPGGEAYNLALEAQREGFGQRLETLRTDALSRRAHPFLPSGFLDTVLADARQRNAEQPEGESVGGQPLFSPEERKQQTVAQAEAIIQMADALAQERDQLTLTNEELFKQQVARQQVSEGIANQLQAMRRQNVLLHDAAEVANFVTDSLIDMATGGEVSLSRLGQTFSRMALSMLADASGLRQALTGLFAQGGQGLLGLFGGEEAVGAGVSAESAAGLASEGALFGAAGGGDIQAWAPYLVGEQGAELVVPRNDSTVIPHGATQALLDGLGGGDAVSAAGARSQRGVTINGPLLVVQAQDAQSFQRSRGEIEAQGMRLLQAMQRGM